MILVVGLLLAVAGVSMVVAKPRSDGTGPFGLLPREQAQISHLESVLDSSSLSAETRENMQNKLAIVQRAADERLQGLADPAPKNPDRAMEIATEDPVEETNIPFPTGIFEGDESTFKPEQALIINRWQGTISNDLIQVFAGCQGQNLEQGLIIILRMTQEGEVSSSEFIPSPTKAGALRILSADNLKLTVQAEDGTQWVFDVETVEFN
jgi:hypothetical protein